MRGSCCGWLAILLGTLTSNGVSGAAMLGMRAGLNIGDASRQVSVGRTSPKSGFLFGAFVEVPVAESRVVRGRIELAYVEKGWKEEGHLPP